MSCPFIHMAVVEWIARALLLIGGLASAGFFMCSANYLTKAPHAVKAALLPGIAGAGIWMAWSGIAGDVQTGGIVAIVQVSAIMGLWFVVWDAGAKINRVLAHRASIPEFQMSDMLAPSHFGELEKDHK